MRDCCVLIKLVTLPKDTYSMLMLKSFEEHSVMVWTSMENSETVLSVSREFVLVNLVC